MLAIDARGSGYAELVFQPQPVGTLMDALVFLNDQNGHTETSISVRAVWESSKTA